MLANNRRSGCTTQ